MGIENLAPKKPSAEETARRKEFQHRMMRRSELIYIAAQLCRAGQTVQEAVKEAKELIQSVDLELGRPEDAP